MARMERYSDACRAREARLFDCYEKSTIRDLRVTADKALPESELSNG